MQSISWNWLGVVAACRPALLPKPGRGSAHLSSVVRLRSYSDPSDIPILVLLDLQQEYIASPRMLAIPNAAAAIDNCRAALAHARAWGFPSLSAGGSDSRRS